MKELVNELMKLTMRKDGTYDIYKHRVRTNVTGKKWVFKFNETFEDKKTLTTITVNTEHMPVIVRNGVQRRASWPLAYRWENDTFYINTKDGEIAF